jgi:hypothetical protein
MMPYIQGDPESVPTQYREGYEDILADLYFKKGDIGYLTIDESPVQAGHAHRAAHAKYDRALHTEAGRVPGQYYGWGDGGGWLKTHAYLDEGTRVVYDGH